MGKYIIFQVLLVCIYRTIMVKFILQEVCKTNSSKPYGSFPYIVFRQRYVEMLMLACIVTMDGMIFHEEVVENSRQ